VVAPNEQVYKQLCAPSIKNGWQKLNQTLELLPSLDTRTVIRHTLAHGWNMDDKYIHQYAKLDLKASPWFIEPKGYVFVGYSRKRMNLGNMPSHQEIDHFTRELSEQTGYDYLAEKADSRVTLLGTDQKRQQITHEE
jgi:tRNA wybutosine-synthesizing protein 1